MKVLITGGAGFVGRHLTKALLKKGWDVTVVDPLVELTGGIHPQLWFMGHVMGFDPTHYDRFTFHSEDCRTYFQRWKSLKPHYDYVFHLAAMVGGRLMIDNNPLAVAEDLSIDADYWKWAKEAQPGKSVIFSSSAAYPITLQTYDNRGYVLTERNIDLNAQDGLIGMPDMSYGWAKLTMEYITKLAYEKHQLKSVVYRPFSGYGFGQDTAYPFPSIMNRVLDHRRLMKPQISVWGSGDQVRDFIHIEDCIAGVLQTMDQVDNGSAINLSTGRATSFKELTKIACNWLGGYDPEIVGTSNMPEGVFWRVGDTTLQESLGFTPTITLEEGISHALINYAESRNVGAV